MILPRLISVLFASPIPPATASIARALGCLPKADPQQNCSINGRFRTILKVLGLGSVLLVGLTPVVPLAAELTNAAAIGSTAPQAFQKYCFECHGTEKPEGDISIETLMTKPSVGPFSDEWEAVAEMLETAEMPPKDAKEFPTDAER